MVASHKPIGRKESLIQIVARRLSSKQRPGPARLGEEEVKVVLGIARGLVRLSKENLAVLMKMQRWQTSQAFPLLDILRLGVRIRRW